MTRLTAALVGVLTALLGCVQSLAAQNIDMSTLPARDSVQLTIYNEVDLTLVRETRRVTLRAGANDLQFSWANTLIDPTSVGFEFRGAARGVELVDTRFDHERSQVARLADSCGRSR
jgi:hypothetical protein